jgi:hypothetical protein
MFRFMSTRRADAAKMRDIDSRLVSDRRVTNPGSLLVRLFGPGDLNSQLKQANQFANTNEFVTADDIEVRALEPAVAFLRARLTTDVSLATLGADFRAALPQLATLLENAPPAALLTAVKVLLARLWDSLYAQTLRGCDRYVSTNYLVDALRVYHVLRLLWVSGKLKLDTWTGFAFDEYDAIIDVEAAMRGAADGPTPNDDSPHAPTIDLQPLQTLTEQIAAIDQVSAQIKSLVQQGAVEVMQMPAGPKPVLDATSIAILRSDPALGQVNLAETAVPVVLDQLRRDRDASELRRNRLFIATADRSAVIAGQRLISQATAVSGAPKTQSPQTPAAGTLFGTTTIFRTELAVGAIKPPVVGDLLLVEQTLTGFGLGDLADIESVLRGERRERTIRTLARTSQTTTTETSSSTEQTSSLTTDERFALSSQAQQTASQSVGVQTGVSVSGKFGPVQVGASVNASFDTSKSTSSSTSQDFAKTVTEEATKRVQSSIKQSSSLTVLTESQNTSLRGFNNEKGTTNLNGLYRWVDKTYTARLLNYGRRLMLLFNPPEPGAFFRALLAQGEAELGADLEEPVPPSGVSVSNGAPIREGSHLPGFDSYKDIMETNYARFAALYDVQVSPPPPVTIAGAKAIAVPTAMEAAKVESHSAERNELSYAAVDSSLSIDPNYQITKLGVFVPFHDEGRSYAETLKLGEGNDVNKILVIVGGRSFHFNVTGQGNNKAPKIQTNFDEMQDVTDSDTIANTMQSPLPISIVADFEGLLTLNILYTAERRPAAFDAWKSQVYADIVQCYAAKKQAYDQSLAAVQTKQAAAVEAKTSALRDDQYRSIEATELKRGCIDLLTQGTAIGAASIVLGTDGTPTTIYRAADASALANWRSPLKNGAVAEFFEQGADWPQMTYTFYPYYWTDTAHWKDLARASSADPLFEQFLRAGSASVLVPVQPGFERSIIFFLKTGLIWGGGYLPLFNNQDMLDVYADVELSTQIDPAEQIGEPWDIRLPTSLVMLQDDGTLPTFEDDTAPEEPPEAGPPLTADDSVPF